MGSIVYLVNHAAVMTPLVVEAALQRCPVGTRTERYGYVQELRRMGTRLGVDPTTGAASEMDRGRFHHIRTNLRVLGLPLFRQKTIWARFSEQWDLLWGVTGKPDRDTLLKVPVGDLQQIIAANRAPYPFVPDLAVRLLLRRQDAEGRTGAKNPFIEAELLRLATEDPLRLYSELGTAYYLRLLGSSRERDATHMIGDLMARGLNGFDGRVIPMVSEVADRHVDIFIPEQMPTLVGLANKFPVLKNVFNKLRSRAELLKAALAACFDDCGRLVVEERVAGRVRQAFVNRDLPRLRDDLQTNLGRWDTPNWQAYAMLWFVRPSQSHRISVVYPPEGEKLPRSLAGFSAPALVDLMLYFELDSQDPDAMKNAQTIQLYLVNHCINNLSPNLGIFGDSNIMARSNLLRSLADAVKARASGTLREAEETLP